MYKSNFGHEEWQVAGDEFYHQFFSFFGAGYVEMLNNCYTGGLMSASMRRGAITLLCKDVTKADQINSWRPITLLNIDYKIMSKVLSNRLKVVLHAIIHPIRLAQSQDAV